MLRLKVQSLTTAATGRPSLKFGTMKIILGSSSPRRRELLSLITDEYEIMTADIDERAIENDLNQRGTEASCVSEALALAKAKAVYDLLSGSSVLKLSL